MDGRLLEYQAGAAAMNLAVEEAVFKLNGGLAVRVWENERSVVIGRGQLANFETDVAYCSRERIPVVRRFTAGGAVYHGPGNLNWSLFVAGPPLAACLEGRRDPAAAFELGGGLAVAALRTCGVDCRLDSRNRIVCPDGKLSGMAAYVSRNALICHGTLLRGADLGEAALLTTPVPVHAANRYVRSKPMKMANCSVSREGFTRELRKAAGERFGADLSERSLTGEEERLAISLVEERYGRDEWNLGDPFWEGG